MTIQLQIGKPFTYFVARCNRNLYSIFLFFCIWLSRLFKVRNRNRLIQSQTYRQEKRTISLCYKIFKQLSIYNKDRIRVARQQLQRKWKLNFKADCAISVCKPINRLLFSEKLQVSIFAYAGEKGKVREGQGKGKGGGGEGGGGVRGQYSGLTSPEIIIFTSLLIMNALSPGTIR